MSRIRVGSGGMFGYSFAQAVAASKRGDELLLAEGVYTLGESIELRDLRLTGTGDPSRTVIDSRVDVTGRAVLTNLTIRAAAFNNALKVMPGCRVEMRGVMLIGDPAEKYPALYVDAGEVILAGCRMVQGPTWVSSVFTADSRLVAQSSELGWLELTGTRAEFHGCAVATVQVLKRSAVRSTGWLICTPAPGKRLLAVGGESVVQIDGLALRGAADPLEISCEESLLGIGAVDLDEGQRPYILRKGAGRVQVPDGVFEVVDEDEQKEAAPPALLMELHWSVSDAHRFTDVILPRAASGATITMDAGEYFLDGLKEETACFDCTLVGASPERTVIHGTLTPNGSGELRLRDLTVRTATGRNCVVAKSGSVALSNVVLEQLGEPMSYPALSATDVVVTMEDSRVAAAPGSTIEGIVELCGTARLEASRSDLGWFYANDQSVLVTDDCSAYGLFLSGSPTIRSTGVFAIRGNTCQTRGLVLNPGTRASFEKIQIGGGAHEGYAEDAVLEVRELRHGEGGSFSLCVAGENTLSVPGEPWYVIETARAGASTGKQREPEAAPGPDDRAADEAPRADEEAPESGVDDPMAEIMLLTGLEGVKEQIASFLNVVKFNELRRRQGLKTSGTTMHSLFLGNPGTGKTTVARLLGKALYQAGAVAKDVFVEVGRRDLVSENLGGSAIRTGKVLERARGGVLFIDEAYSLYQKEHNQFAQEAVDTILSFMENERDEIVVIFAGYDEPMQDFLRMNPGLASRVPNTFTFEDYTPDEIATIGVEALHGDDYRIADEDLYRRIASQQYERSISGGNGRWVRNFNEALIMKTAERVLREAEQGRVDGADPGLITTDDLYELAGGDEDQRQDAVNTLLSQLDDLVGLAPVKAWVHELIDEARANKLLAEQGLAVEHPTYHMVFAGRPGTGKTTVASIIAQLFHNLGLLERPTVHEVDRSDLVGAYFGHTEEKTTRAVDNAMGGVLFIDEAYQLYGASENDFGRMAIETLITRLENDRDKFVVIFAGYTKEMERFLDANEGLRSRVPRMIEFPDYSPDEIGDMVVARLSRSWTLDRAAVHDIAARAYAGLPAQDRSNGRWARTFADAVVTRHKRWIVKNQPTGEAVLAIDTEMVRSLAQETGADPR